MVCFYSLLEQIIDVLNVAEPSDRETNQFDQLEYVFIDDPVSSLDDNHLIELAVNLAELIKSNESDLKFIITTHNPLFIMCCVMNLTILIKVQVTTRNILKSIG